MSNATQKRDQAREKRIAYDTAVKQARQYRDNPAAFVGQQGTIATNLDKLTVSDLRDLLPDGVSKSKDGKPAPKPILIERFCQWVELGGVLEAKPAKPVKAKPAKKEKPDPAAVFNECLDFLGDLTPGGEDLTGPERGEHLKRLAELVGKLPLGKASDKLTVPTLRNIVAAINDGMSEGEKPLPVSGPKAKLAERIATYFGLIDPPEVKRAVAWERLADFSDADLSAELERRRQQSPAYRLVAGGIC